MAESAEIYVLYLLLSLGVIKSVNAKLLGHFRGFMEYCFGFNGLRLDRWVDGLVVNYTFQDLFGIFSSFLAKKIE